MLIGLVNYIYYDQRFISDRRDCLEGVARSDQLGLAELHGTRCDLQKKEVCNV